MAERTRFLDRSGVSETIGFIIIFGIVMTGIGIVTLYGYPALIQEQSNANIKNMEKNMLVLQSDLKSLTFKSVPYQESTIQVSGGTLIFENPPANPSEYPYFEVNITGSPTKYHLGELRYITSDGQATVTLENGAVHIRYWSSPLGSAMLSPPSWYYDSQTGTYVIQMIRMNASSYLAQTGIGVVQMQLSNSNQLPPQDVDSNDYITYKPSFENHYGVAWSNYLRSPGLMLKENSGNFYFKDNSTLVIKEYNATILSI